MKADQIISEHTLTRINSVFDQELMKVAGPLDQALRGHRFKWTIDGAEHGIRFESTSKYVEVVVQRMSDESGQLSSEPQMDGQSQLAVRAHRAFVQQLLDVGGMVRLQSTLAGLMADPVDQQAFGAMRPQGCKFLWSPDRDWLVLDFFRERSLSDASPAEQPASANVAATRGP